MPRPQPAPRRSSAAWQSSKLAPPAAMDCPSIAASLGRLAYLLRLCGVDPIPIGRRGGRAELASAICIEICQLTQSKFREAGTTAFKSLGDARPVPLAIANQHFRPGFGKRLEVAVFGDVGPPQDG